MSNNNASDELQFFSAINSGDVAQVRSMVADAPELLLAYNPDYFGATPLTSVASSDDREMIQVLLELGADPNRRSDWGMGPWSPLHMAIYSNKMELARYLLDHGAELDVHTAAALGGMDDLNRLLDADPDRISEPGGDGCTPLHFAGTTDAAQLLLDRGADIDARCVDHFSTPLQYLADPRPEIARYLISKGAQVDIFSAAMCGEIECVRKLVADDPMVLNQKIDQTVFPPGPDHDVQNILTFTVGGGCSPLHAAVCGNQPQTIAELIELGGDPNTRGGYDDASPLHLAAWRDNKSAAVQLIKSGADINLRSGKIHNNTPAGWAIVAGSADVFELLMDHNCEILEFFKDDAAAAVNGKFRQYKVVPQDNYDRIQSRLN